MIVNYDNIDKQIKSLHFIAIKSAKGFTLIELLVVISIIGLLASVVLVALGDSRKKARDAKRKSDLAQIAKAVEMYNYNNPSNGYIITGTGYNSCSCGWFNVEGGSNYIKSIAHGLEEAGVLAKAPRDPSINSDAKTPQYMKYQCGKGFYVYAKLENPTAEDLQTYTDSKNSGCNNLDTYGMNYAVGHK